MTGLAAASVVMLMRKSKASRYIPAHCSVISALSPPLPDPVSTRVCPSAPFADSRYPNRRRHPRHRLDPLPTVMIDAVLWLTPFPTMISTVADGSDDASYGTTTSTMNCPIVPGTE